MDEPKYIHVGPNKHDFSAVLGEIEHKHGFTAVRERFELSIKENQKLTDQKADEHLEQDVDTATK